MNWLTLATREQRRFLVELKRLTRGDPKAVIQLDEVGIRCRTWSNPESPPLSSKAVVGCHRPPDYRWQALPTHNFCGGR